jgi:thioredoxin reductase
MVHDVVIIGGSFAGLSAALYLGRAQRSVLIVDRGKPRNRFSGHAHGIFGHDGSNPADILAIARTQVRAYPTIRIIEGAAAEARSAPHGFATTLASGETLDSSRLLLAYGITDELPPIPGVAERWGQSVLHCPYCHGYEFRGNRLGVLYLSPMSLHQAMLVAEWGPTTLFLNGHKPSGDEENAVRGLVERGVAIEESLVQSLHGEGPALSALELEGARRIDLDALYIGPRNHPNVDLAHKFGCDHEAGPLGIRILVSAEQETTVRGVYAAGDITRFAHNATAAIADGVMAATSIHRSLVFQQPAPAIATAHDHGTSTSDA